MPTCPACSHSWEPRQRPLTARQREVLDFILSTMASKRHAPSLQEIATAFGFRSLATVHEHLSNLEIKGYLVRDYNRARSISAVA